MLLKKWKNTLIGFQSIMLTLLSFSEGKLENTGPTPGTRHSEKYFSMKIRINIYKWCMYINLGFWIFWLCTRNKNYDFYCLITRHSKSLIALVRNPGFYGYFWVWRPYYLKWLTLYYFGVFGGSMGFLKTFLFDLQIYTKIRMYNLNWSHGEFKSYYCVFHKLLE